jgi:hypothetical protein
MGKSSVQFCENALKKNRFHTVPDIVERNSRIYFRANLE